jgi:tetratricopeptide (TPR) repeat protein
MDSKVEFKKESAKWQFYLASTMFRFHELTAIPDAKQIRLRWAGLLIAATLLGLLSTFADARHSASQQATNAAIEGTVKDAAGKPIPGASVFFQEKTQANATEARTDANGRFQFLSCRAGSYSLRVAKEGFRDLETSSFELRSGEQKRFALVLERTKGAQQNSTKPMSGALEETMEFDDKPNFVVAGVTDWSNAGLHGSDTRERTSQALAKETIALGKNSGENTSSRAPGGKVNEGTRSETERKLHEDLADNPASFEANHELGDFYFRNRRYLEAIPLLDAAYGIDPNNEENGTELALAYKSNGELTQAREQAEKMQAMAKTADAHRLVGNLDEELGDPLSAEHEYEKAVRLDPSEQNYFEWGAELLLHKADDPAVEVFAKGSAAYPHSWRMLIGLGAALYASGSYDEAARRFCEASDLNQSDETPYLLLGKIEKATVPPLPCAEGKLARFARERPDNPTANYYYAIALWKHGRAEGNAEDVQRSEALLEKAVSLSPAIGEAYLQLGILQEERGDFSRAMQSYKRAIEAKPELAEAHRRLASVYKRKGEDAKAQAEFEAYQQAEKAETAEMDEERRELRQFLVILKDSPRKTSPH